MCGEEGWLITKGVEVEMVVGCNVGGGGDGGGDCLLRA